MPDPSASTQKQTSSPDARPFNVWYADVQAFLVLRDRLQEGEFDLKDWAAMAKEYERLAGQFGVDHET